MGAPGTTRAHLIGLAVGAGMGAVFLIPSGSGHHEGLLTNFGVAGFAGGSVGGWVAGPAAWRARSTGDWLGAIAILAAVAVLVGDAVVVAGSGTGARPLDDPLPPSEALRQMASLYLLGLVVVGWLYFGTAFLIGSLWAFGIAMVRGIRAAAPADR